MDEKKLIESLENSASRVDQYQLAAHSFAKYGDNKMYPLLGLAEEAGEALGKVAKFIRKHEGVCPHAAMGWETMRVDAVAMRDALSKELGDICWMLAEVATTYGLRLEDIMTENIEKLTDRKARGVIVGEGDNR